jgi:uracil-DNA glycosylase
MNKLQALNALHQKETENKNSPLFVDGNTNIVFGEGNCYAQLMIIGEAPGKNEDIQKKPFVGRAGKLLDKALAECNLFRKDIYITNIVKTRPSENRTPTEEEMSRSWPFLEKQINIIQPHVICSVGACATNALLKKKIPITKIHGLALPFNDIIIVPTFHPAYVLRDPRKYKDFLQDLQFVTQIIKNINK